MKRKAPKFLRLFMVLALLTAVIGTVVPVGKIGAGHGAQTAAVALSTTRVGTVAVYTITTTGFTNLPVGGTVTVTFPSGTTVPSTISRTAVSIDGVAPSADPLIVGRAVTITWNGAAVIADGTPEIIFTTAAGIVNPTTPSATLTASITTSADATAEVSAAYTVARYLAFSPSTGAVQGGTITLTGGGFTGGTTITASGSVSGTALVNTDGSFSIAGSRRGTGTTATATDGAGNALTTGAVPLLASITTTSTGKFVNQTVTVEGRNFTVGRTITNLADITFGGTAIVAGNLVETVPVALTDRDLDGVADDFRLRIRVPSGTPTKTSRISVTDGVLSANLSVATVGRALTISPASGRTGTIAISGTGFPASQAAVAGNTITLTQAGVAGVLATPLLSTDTAGNITTGLTFTMPALIPGTATAIASGALTVTASVAAPAGTGDAGANTASATYTYSATSRTLGLSPVTGPRGTVVTVTGSSFTAGNAVAIGGLTLGGLAVNTAAIAVNADGTLAASTQTIPGGTAYGANTMLASDGVLTGTTTFTAEQPTIAISPTSGPTGGNITVTGGGWLPNGLVTVSRAGTAALTTTADGLGNITAQVPIPSSVFTGGTVRLSITATDSSLNAAAAQIFTVTSASIAASPGTAAVGDTVTVTGSNYLPSTGLTVFTIGGVSVLPRDPVISNTTGTWSASFTVPGLSGVQTVTTTHSAVTRTATLTITAAAGGAGQPLATETAVAVLTAASSLELVTSFNYTTNIYEAFVPGLAGNPLTQIQPNSVIILTLTSDTSVVVSGNTFSVTANVPTPIPVGNTVSITLS